jgi:hypothetical protein
MIRVILILLFLVGLPAAAGSVACAAASPPGDYNDVKHLYELALQAIDEIEDLAGC